ncbi:MAG: AAA family ATPase [Armatimonadetes bacterium]|nr:AAA family ATPase [Armatimonadota bacterium]
MLETEPVIPNYTLTRKLGESPQSIVYTGFHKRFPKRPLVIKILRVTSLSGYHRSYFRQKIEHLKILRDPALITPISLESKRDLQFVTQEYFEGLTLDDWSRGSSGIALPNFFVIGCQLARALNSVHEAGIIHCGVKPHNILINPETLEVRVTDFITSMDVREISHFFYDPSFVRGTLAYTSPEQTGRIHHRVDFSTDLYSLGIVLYELLTGQLPFFSPDPLELIHSHLAVEAQKVHRLNPEIPETVSRIVGKLLVKQQEKRYQSGKGLLSDLSRCRDEFAKTGAVGKFALGASDQTHRVIFIAKMVGRDPEARTILNEYDRTAEGSFRSLLISGLPGIGKTRLIQELQQPIVRHRGYFTSGKFDLYQRNIPYSALIQALRNLIRIFLTESDQRVAQWKRKICQAVGDQGQVIIDVIPELEILLGPQQPVKPLPPVESRNRFHGLFDCFLTALASEENPLTLFVDDLQWCDIASFEFLTNIFANHRDHPYLFLIGAYRHNEVDSSHPLTRLISGVKEKSLPLVEIELAPLAPIHCHEMVSYILDSPLPQTEALAGFICRLTEGNPLFVSESLSYLHHEDLLYLDENRHWRWDLEKIRESNMPSSVVALFSSKIRKLPLETIAALEYCACLGNTFVPEIVATVNEKSLLETFRILTPALGQGLLMENKNRFQFIHDRVQEAVLCAIPPEKRRIVHWRIGNHLLPQAPKDGDQGRLDNLFEIASHLNMGKPEDLAPEDVCVLSHINFQAGARALEALATDAANEYFRTARELLPPDCWDRQYEKTFKIFQKGAKTELMCGNYEKSEKLLNELLDHARTDLDKAECLAEQTTSLSSIGNFIKAVETANRGLAYFNKSIPTDASLADKRRDELMGEIHGDHSDVWAAILSMPFTEDRKSKIELAFYSELIPDLYMSGLVPQLYLSAAQSTRHCLEGGMDESVIYSFSIMGLQLGEQGEFEEAFRYEDLAHELSAKYPNTFGATRGMNGIVWCNMHSRSHPETIVDYCLKSIQCGKNCGDLYNAGLSYGPLMWNLQVQGANFQTIEAYADECLRFSQKYQLTFSTGLAEAMQAGWIEPMKQGFAPLSDQKLTRWANDNHIASIGSYYVHMGLSHYYLGNCEEAARYLEGVRRYLTGLTDNVLKRQWHAFVVLNALGLHERSEGRRDDSGLRAWIAPYVRNMETWASFGPILKPYLAFVYAEMERVLGDPGKARGLYLDAIAISHEEGFTFLEGHLNECLADLLASEGKSLAVVYYAEALHLYRKCRAERKETALLERHPEIETDTEDSPISGPRSAPPFTSYALPNLDAGYLMKSSQAISAEIEQGALISKIMNVLLESSGAQDAYFLTDQDGDLSIRAESHVFEKNVVRYTNRRLDDCADICQGVVRYVYRTQEKFLLNYGCGGCEFKGSPGAHLTKYGSLLCLPVVKQTKLLGIVFLENKLADSVFTPEKTQIIQLLTSQAAIALENAKLVEGLREAETALQQYGEHLEEVVEERTRELRKAQQDLLVAERLATMGQLAGSISHEIRNPLSVIAGSIYYLKRKLGDPEGKVKEHLDRIESQVTHSVAIIESLLNLSGSKPLHKEHQCLMTLLEKTMAASQIPGIRVTEELPREEIFVDADGEQLRMVFKNIINNAVQAVDGEGKLVLRVERDGEHRVRISFKDNGCGIAPENLEKVFQPLFTTKAQGIGFGLSICKMIIEKHQGTIAIESKEGEGTTVFLTLPSEFLEE